MRNLERPIWRDPYLWGIFFGILFLVAVLVVWAARAQEHQHGVDAVDWYDPACCNQRDCRPVKDEDIEFDQVGGDLVARYKPTGNIFHRSQFRKSQDERYHVCIYNGTSFCFYDRAGA